MPGCLPQFNNKSCLHIKHHIAEMNAASILPTTLFLFSCWNCQDHWNFCGNVVFRWLTFPVRLVSSVFRWHTYRHATASAWRVKNKEPKFLKCLHESKLPFLLYLVINVCSCPMRKWCIRQIPQWEMNQFSSILKSWVFGGFIFWWFALKLPDEMVVVNH